nr:MAG TPA: hypothetical protein [Caudoviricetes sp.]
MAVKVRSENYLFFIISLGLRILNDRSNRH